jgi:dipeptidyl aminopeptidase/acylaminoacyl peptidase
MLLIALLLAFSAQAYAQEKRPLDHDVYDGWNRIQGQALSDDGRWVLYTVSPQEGDGELYVKALRSETSYVVPRGESAQFAEDNRFVVFLVKPALALVRESQKEDSTRDAQPRDSLGILDLTSGEITKVERVKSFALPKEAGGWLAYHLEAGVEEPDTTQGGGEGRPARPRGMRRPGGLPGRGTRSGEGEGEKQDGTVLVLRNLSSGAEQQFEKVQTFAFSTDGRRLAYTASSKDSTADGAFVVATADGSVTTMLAGAGDYKSVTFDEAGEQIAFLSNRDDYASKQPSFTLYRWRPGSETAAALVSEGADGIPAGWWVSENGDLSFSDNGSRLFFGTAPRPEPEPEEEIPEWEKVEVDIWNWQDPLLQPMQLVRRNQELRRSYQAVVHLSEGRTVQLADLGVPEVTVGMDGDADVAIAATEMPYRKEVSWDSPGYNDVYLIDVNSGDRRMVLERLQSRDPQLSADAKYITWWDGHALAWFALDVNGGDPINLSGRVPYPLFDESDDHPMIPGSYGSAGWTDGDRLFLVYDKHDIWATDPTGSQAPRNVTEGVGRNENLRFRYMSYDPDEDGIPEDEPIYLGAFDMETKDAGFYLDRVRGERRPERLLMAAKSFGGGGFGRFGRGLTKADDADVFLLTRQSFEEFPDLWVSDLSFSDMQKVSDANPQQAQYLWGTAELTHWMSTDGNPLTGILIKPEGFDPSKKYPMMVYFYETMSDRLHSYDGPFGGGSSVSLSFYASRGYVVFVPDIHYRDGYPGESAFDCLVPGVLSVIAQGFVDPKRVGVQGHSWGGYQIAYLVTKTNVFAAAEAGAPVVNMTSAYGGIRWGTGMSRMFQYERTQSRIGGSLWEAQPRYIENSPLFWADKVETPVLMLHNDEDTAVPWYQGIEYFVALRRLNKPVWMINYNGEQHGLRQYQNQTDWQTRMQQFFDHYLMDAQAPVWLAEGVPAVMKGKTLGLEFVGEETKATTSGNSP